MTRRQVAAAMKSARIVGELSGAGRNWEVELSPTKSGQKDDKTMRKFQKLVAVVGGYTTGYNAWVLSPNYQDKGDFNSKSSAWHY